MLTFFSLVSFVFVWGWMVIGWNQPSPGMSPRSVQYDPVEACFEFGGWTRFKICSVKTQKFRNSWNEDVNYETLGTFETKNVSQFCNGWSSRAPNVHTYGYRHHVAKRWRRRCASAVGNRHLNVGILDAGPGCKENGWPEDSDPGRSFFFCESFWESWRGHQEVFILNHRLFLL